MPSPADKMIISMGFILFRIIIRLIANIAAEAQKASVANADHARPAGKNTFDPTEIIVAEIIPRTHGRSPLIIPDTITLFLNAS